MTKKHKQENHSGAITGTIVTTGSGLGFVSLPDFDEDIRIERGNLNTALNGDTVKIQLHSRKKAKQQTGEVIQVLNRKKTRFVGVFECKKNHCFFIPDDRKIYTDILIPNPPSDVSKGYKVLVELISWSDATQDPVGKIIQTLGKPGDHDVEMRSIVLDKNIDIDFPQKVAQEAQNIKKTWDEKHKEYISSAVSGNERKDFRSVTTFTIDPHDAKDFDDALSLRETTIKDTGKKGYEVGIHIADVSHFVKPDSELDKEARQRGFSTYLVDRTIPMLPEELSNDLCSLNPNTDRLAFSALFTLDENAHIQNRWFGKSVIHSDKRFSYEEAQKTLDEQQGVLHSELALLHSLSQKLRTQRIQKGSIDFETEEIEIELDSDNAPAHIYRKKLLATNKLIEDFMLMANKEVAQYIFKSHKSKNVPKGFVYRVHDAPDTEKLEKVGSLLQALGYPTFYAKGRSRKNKTAITPKDINAVIKAIKGTAIEPMIKTAILRSMSKAAYSTKNIGHFGLGFSYYTHFTSPIRRYADLLVHRLLLQHLDGSEVSSKEARVHTELAWQLSQKEITVQEAERESIKYKQVEYMQSRIGTQVSGIITGVTEWGFYVADKETGAEGLVRVASLRDDYYLFEEHKYQLVGKKTKKKYTLGDTLLVKIKAANIEQKTIDFEVI